VSDTGSRRVVVLDDDPTGTQASAGLPILLDPGADPAAPLATTPAFHVLTNTRALDRPAAVALITGLRERIDAAAARLGLTVGYVLRGDTTLRGHLLAEAEALAGPHVPLVFAPAYPGIGRRTVGGVQQVLVGGQWRNAADTEFARDPVFGYTGRSMAERIAEECALLGRPPRPVTVIAADDLDTLPAVLTAAAPDAVLVPDARTDDDLLRISGALDAVRSPFVLRCAAPLAALRTGHPATGPVQVPTPPPGGLLVVCGSHTGGAGRQLAALVDATGAPVREIDTGAALADPEAAAAAVVDDLRQDLASGMAVLATARVRRAEHNTVADGARVMTALQTAVRAVRPAVGAVIAKGGITSAATATDGLGAGRAQVLGPLLPGVPLWQVPAADGRELLLAVVPGNVGGDATMTDVAALIAAGTKEGRWPRAIAGARSGPAPHH
jgi:hypothetical protein